jgi:hypothetical protein
MGAKFTIVLDTDDPQGLRDALQIALLLNKNHGNRHPLGTKVELTKIPLIKLVREIAKLVEAGKMDSSLRSSKQFVDNRWDSLVHKAQG